MQKNCNVAIHRIFGYVVAALLLATVLTAQTASARQGLPPRSGENDNLRTMSVIASVQLPSIDAAALRAQANAKTSPGPLQVAQGMDISIDLEDGTWENTDGGRIWRVRVEGSGALHLNFGFGALHLPPGATLHIISVSDPTAYVGPYTTNDATPRGLWTPMVPGDSAVIELFVPEGGTDPVLEITRVGLGFVDLFGLSLAKHELNACHIDVICPASFMDDQERAVARLLTDNAFLCTGTLINDVGGTRRPFILTAEHCGITTGNSATVVALFNFKTAACGTSTPGPTTDTVSGSTLLASRVDVDGALIELNSSPPQSFNVFFAGWDRSNTTPSGTSGIHHPGGTSMTYCEDTNAPVTINNCIGGGGINSHWQATWTLGITAGGSSGSALLDRTSRRVIGFLSGGLSFCDGTVPNGEWDCYGKLAVFWDGVSAGTRLKDWLDPLNTGALTVDGIEGNTPACLADGFEPDDNSVQAGVIVPATPNNHSICPVGDEDWSTFTLTEETGIVVQTSGGPFPEDTRMWLRDGGGTEIEFNDDIDVGTNRHSRIDRVCGVDALPAGTYFVEVDEYDDDDEIPSYALTLTTTPCSCSQDVSLFDQTLSGTQSYLAANSVGLGPNLNIDGPDISVQAPTVRMSGGTRISGSFRVSNDSPCP